MATQNPIAGQGIAAKLNNSRSGLQVRMSASAASAPPVTHHSEALGTRIVVAIV